MGVGWGVGGMSGREGRRVKEERVNEGLQLWVTDTQSCCGPSKRL